VCSRWEGIQELTERYVPGTAKWRAYTKTVVAVLGGLVTAVTPIAAGSGDISVAEIIQDAVVLLTALGVFGFENKGNTSDNL
jgi:bifunctional pyridoxal-dependent enzyme with beta-cystathionase and maltose regulon repressor activities